MGLIGGGQTLDVSNYQPAIIPAAWKDAGVERLIVGCQRPDIARSQIASARAAGIVVRAVYAYLYGNSGDSGQVQNAIDVAREFGLFSVWLDAEEAALTIQGLRNAVAQVEAAGFEAGIYTGPYYWINHMGNTTEFACLPLWYASYLYTGVVLREVSFGGWTRAAVHQYTTTGTRNDSAPGGISPQIAGVDVDYDFDFEPIPEADMIDQDLRDAMVMREQIRGVASNIDLDVVKKAIAALKAAGVIS